MTKTTSDLKAGDTAFMFGGLRGGSANQQGTPATVTRVGRIYLYVKPDNSHSEAKFDRASGLEAVDGHYRRTLTVDREAYIEQRQIGIKFDRLRRHMPHRPPADLTMAQLDEIARLLGVTLTRTNDD